MQELESIDIVEDRTATSRCDEGFLRVHRLVLRNHYQDGSQSEPYNCDIVERRQVDAVAVALYEQHEEGGKRRVKVLLRNGIRAPIYLRKDRDHNGRDEPLFRTIYEIVAGVIEDKDEGEPGVKTRAVAEIHEESGIEVGPEAIATLGAPFFPSPGITPEKVYLAACEAPLDKRSEAIGDGSVMEEGASVEIFELREAITMCRTGAILDAKTEIALLRLADLVGYLPQLDCFVDELPEDLLARYQNLGLG